MNEHPIIFSAPMIRAILDGCKSMTRRAVKPQPRRALDPISISSWEPGITAFKPGDFGVYREGTPSGRWGLESVIRGRYKKGDLLWVKETWCQSSYSGCPFNHPARQLSNLYAADDGLQRFPVGGNWVQRNGDFLWKPSIFMPRWASRITLEVTADERIERLQEITEWDAYNEGFNEIGEFFAFWDSLNAGRGYPVKSNPWVRVIAFKRIKP